MEVGGEWLRQCMISSLHSLKLFCKANEVAIMDNQQWTNVHVYIMKDWYQFPILLTLEHVEPDATTCNIIAILLKCMTTYGQLLVEKLGSRWVCIGCDKDFMFQGTKVTSQLKFCVIPFSIGVHYMAHKLI